MNGFLSDSLNQRNDSYQLLVMDMSSAILVVWSLIALKLRSIRAHTANRLRQRAASIAGTMSALRIRHHDSARDPEEP